MDIVEIIKLVVPTVTIIGFLIKPIKEILKQIKHSSEAIGVLLRDRLMGTYDYLIGKGWAGVREKEEFSKLCENYWGFGYNSFSKGLLEDILDLPNKP